MTRIALCSLLALVPAIAAADALTDLRATLAQFPATAAVHGTLDVTSSVHSNEEEKPENGKATVGFDASDTGLRILYPRPVLLQADQEARSEAADPEHATPARSGLRRVRPLHLAELADGAAALNVILESAKLVDAKPVSFRGKPARLLAFKLVPKMSKSANKHMKEFDSTLSVWLGEGGVPIAAEKTTHAKASFLLISFVNDVKESWTYTRAGDRLVVTRYDESATTDGFGQHNSTQVTEVLRIE